MNGHLWCQRKPEGAHQHFSGGRARDPGNRALYVHFPQVIHVREDVEFPLMDSVVSMDEPDR